MRRYKPQTPYTTPIELYIPTYMTKKGVRVKSYPSQGVRLNCSWKSYGGTDTTINNMYVVQDTAYVETWFRPDITSECKIKVIDTGVEYEIINNPEDIEMRHQYIKFKVQAIKGGA